MNINNIYLYVKQVIYTGDFPLFRIFHPIINEYIDEFFAKYLYMSAISITYGISFAYIYLLFG